MNRLQLAFFLCHLVVIPIGSRAQQCQEAMLRSTPSDRFQTSPDGAVLDRRTGLIWARCSVGQNWDKNKRTCTGNPRLLTWQQANQITQRPQFGSSSWRLPTIRELSSIVELSCVQPAINLRWFPNTPASHYWSSTPFSSQPGHYWLLQFLSGDNHTDTGKRLALTRLVMSPRRQDEVREF